MRHLILELSALWTLLPAGALSARSSGAQKPQGAASGWLWQKAPVFTLYIHPLSLSARVTPVTGSTVNVFTVNLQLIQPGRQPARRS